MSETSIGTYGPASNAMAGEVVPSAYGDLNLGLDNAPEEASGAYGNMMLKKDYDEDGRIYKA